MRNLKTKPVFLGLLILAGAIALARHAAAAKDYTISDRVDLVLLDVCVKNPDGGYVTGLHRDDFKVFEDGQPRTITHFSSVDTPVGVGLVLDNSGSMIMKRGELITAGLAFAAGSNPKDEYFVVNFNNSVAYGLPRKMSFTDDLGSLQRAINYARPVGQTALYDAIASALGHLRLSSREMRTLIVVSDGGDNVSHTTLPELIQDIEASRATIYTVGLLDEDDRDLNPRILRKIAAISGGEYFQPDSAAEVVPVFQTISRDIRNRYVIGYVPDELQDKRLLRTIKLKAKADGRKLIVHARTSYSLNPGSKTDTNPRTGNVSTN